MLARIQTVYLFIAALLAVASMFVPFWSFSAAELVYFRDFGAMEAAGLVQVSASYAAGIFSPLTAIAAIAAIFLYRNRTLQAQLIGLSVVLFVCDLLSGLVAAHFMNEYFEQSAAVSHNPEAGLFMMLPEPVLLWLALKGVKKDDKIANAYKRL
ncbi:MAG: DUF4293 domain-containing protein [Chlorobium sp.]|uniref:DUF4293 domain-containing protein n=1 Tax=Chlorobium sp. TaxID=1095 RepID=UPI0025B7C732|nr:DUF4293 domain-containing protein [Chlorobium sp.]MCF8216146.1 DUF4293 domain-containing protein [Chlorobium sp.]MCF8271108.1 DUF4293 domain-containing protein [Chlorobium sp.]MCF8287422.1 DUF4293 domain-containing protein [Chlorobium sp.]MCF8291021.1 DUF4293 domain-containing protein [Chlorobium sp.]MCF8385116.1 DUF4293 domain-containing protein [Chlorobium sp.]